MAQAHSPARRVRSARLGHAPVQAAVTDGLAEVGHADLRAGLQIGDGAGDLEDAAIGPGREPEALHGPLQQAQAGRFQGAEAPSQGGVHLGVAEAAEALQTLMLSLAGGHHLGPQHRRGRAGGVGRQLLEGHRRHLHLKVDAVQKRPRDPGQVLAHLLGRAGAGPGRVAVEPAGTQFRCPVTSRSSRKPGEAKVPVILKS